jgi:hypothetical protein
MTSDDMIDSRTAEDWIGSLPVMFLTAKGIGNAIEYFNWLKVTQCKNRLCVG